jgi:AcrR family transcriptional regulator
MKKEIRRGKGKISRKDVIAAARDLFTEKGFHRTSLDDIVARLGLGKGTFYAFFDGKEDLLFAVIDQAIDELIDHMDNLVGDEQDPIKRLQIKGYGFVDMYDSHYGLIDLLMGEAMAGDHSSLSKSRKIYRKLASNIIEEINLINEQGILKIDDPEFAAYALIGAIEMLCFRHQMDNKYPREKIIQNMTQILVGDAFKVAEEDILLKEN